MLYAQASPPFEKLVLTLSFIVRSIPAIIDEFDINNTRDVIDRQATREEKLAVLLQNRGYSNFFVPISQSFGLPQEPTRDPPMLSQECVQGLFLSMKLYRSFYDNITKCGFENEEWSKCISHLCFKNKEYSKKIAKFILKGTNSS